MRRNLTYLLWILICILAGCGGGGGSPAGSPTTLPPIVSSTTEGNIDPPTSPTNADPATATTFTTANATVTIPAGALLAAAWFDVTEHANSPVAVAATAAVLTSPVVVITSQNAQFALNASISVTLTSTDPANAPELLVLTHSSGVSLPIPLPDGTRQARPSPVRVTVPASYLNLPGATSVGLYRFPPAELRTERVIASPTEVLNPNQGDRYVIELPGFNTRHPDLAWITAAAAESRWFRTSIAFNYDYRRRADLAATDLFALLDELSCPLASSKSCLTIVGYSYGGIVARLLANRLVERGATVDSVITIGTPNLGAPLSENFLTVPLLNLTNGRGPVWRRDDAALATVSGADGILAALNRAPRQYAWTAIGGSAFPALPPNRDLVTEALRFVGTHAYGTDGNDGLVATSSALPFGLTRPFYRTIEQPTQHHFSLLDAAAVHEYASTFVTPYGRGRTKVSQGTQWAPLNGTCFVQAGRPSGYGRFVPYETDQTDNLPGDANRRRDGFLFDQLLRTTELVSRDHANQPMTGSTRSLSVSADGQVVAFAANHPLGRNGHAYTRWNVYCHDRGTNTTTCLTAQADGREFGFDCGATDDFVNLGVALTPDGRFVIYAAFDSSGYSHIYRHDRTTGQTTRIDLSTAGALANSYSSDPTVSDNGQRVAFVTLAGNLGGYPSDSRTPKVYLRDLALSQTSLASRASTGAPATGVCELPMLSGNGQAIAFVGEDPTLAATTSPARRSLYLRRLDLATTTLVSVDQLARPLTGSCSYPSVDRTGRFIAFTRSTDAELAAGVSNVWLTDTKQGAGTCLTLNDRGETTNGLCYWPSLSSDGSTTHFASYTTTFGDNPTAIVQDYVSSNPWLEP